MITLELKDVEIDYCSGCEGIWLGTEADNLAALALYRSLGADEVAGVYFGWDDGI